LPTTEATSSRLTSWQAGRIGPGDVWAELPIAGVVVAAAWPRRPTTAAAR
jgi:hypothetical protein